MPPRARMPAPPDALSPLTSTAAAARPALAALALLASAARLEANARPIPVPPSEPPEAIAVRGTAAPAVDGDVLGDPAWAAVPPLTGFWQTTPDAGAPGVGADRGPHRLHRRHALRRRRLPRPRAGRHRRLREPARLRRSTTPTASRSSSTPTATGRTASCSAPTRPASSTTARSRTRARAAGPSRRARSLGGFNLNWDASWTVRTRDRRLRLERRVRDPVPHAALRRGKAPGLGPQLPAQHPPPQREGATGRRCRASTASTACRARARSRASSRRASAT